MSNHQKQSNEDGPAETLRSSGWFGWTTRKDYLGPFLLLHPARPAKHVGERILECVRITLRCLWQNFNGCQWSMPTLRTYVATLRGRILINS